MRFKTGQEVPVYYDARRPGRSVLLPGTSTKSWLAVVIGAGLILFWVKTVSFLVSHHPAS